MLRSVVKRIEAYGVFVALEGHRRHGLVHTSQVGRSRGWLGVRRWWGWWGPGGCWTRPGAHQPGGFCVVVRRGGRGVGMGLAGGGKS